MKIHVLIIFCLSSIIFTQPFNPDNFKNDDLFFTVNDHNNYLIAAKYFTSNSISEYIKNQGISLDKETTCSFQNQVTFSDYTTISNLNTDYKELYSNIVYDDSKNNIICDFPVQKFLNIKYKLVHKLNIINYLNSNNRLQISMGDEDNLIQIFDYWINPKSAILLSITINSLNNDPMNPNFDNSLDTESYKISYSINNVEQPGSTNTISIKKIQYSFTNINKSPGLSFYYTIMNIEPKPLNYKANGYYTITGKSICDNLINPCVESFACKGGECVKCDASCFDCYESDSNTNCGRKCNIHSSTPYSDNGKCSLGYVDLSMFQNININDIPPPRNNRMTISFWFYISNYINLSSQINLPSIKAKLITLIFNSPDSNNKMTIQCTGDPFITEPFLIEDKWVYFKVGVSKDHVSGRLNFYQIYSNPDDININEEKNFGYNRLYNASHFGDGHPDINNHNNYKYYFHEGDVISLNFENFDSFELNDGHFFIKNFALFKEYLPIPDFKYYHLEKLISSNNELPELLFIIPFDHLERNMNSYIIQTYYYDSKLSKSTMTIFPSKKRTEFSLIPPRNFKRLPLLEEKNTKFSRSDFLSTETITPEQNSIFMNNDGKIISCETNYFLDFDNNKCNQNCPNTKSMVYGLNIEKGFCNYKCKNTEKCLSTQSEIQNIKTLFQCNDRINDFEMFYTCEKKNEEKVFYFNSRYTPANIILDFTNYKFDSYIIEFWMFIDTTNHGPSNLSQKYLFYTKHVMLLYGGKQHSNFNTFEFTIETSAIVENKVINDIINIYEWNHIIINVVYDPNEGYNKKTKVYIIANNKNFEDANSLKSLTENKMTLEKIYFCNGDPSKCDGEEIYWSSAFYKNLKVFNGDSAQPYLIKRYNDIYKKDKIASLIAYYPLTGQSIQNNNLYQYVYENYDTGNSYLKLTETFNSWNFPQYNYAKEFDYIDHRQLYGNLIDENKQKQRCVVSNCKRCHFNDICYECKDNFILLENQCVQNSIPDNGKVLKLPHGTSFNIKLSDAITKPAITINFWIKFYGFFSSDSGTIINYSDNLKLKFSVEREFYGLNLVETQGSSEIILGNFYHFRHYIGNWTFISVSYYYKNKERFFPPLLRFELFNENAILKNQMSDELKFDNIYFDDNLYALFKSLKIYQTFLVGAYSFDYHDKSSYISPLTNINFNDWPEEPTKYFEPNYTCLLADNRIIKNDDGLPNYNCVDDHYDYTIFNEENINKFRDGIKGKEESDLCFKDNNIIDYKICFKEGEKGLACNFRNNQEEFFLGKWNDFYCKKYDFINFAKIQGINDEKNNEYTTYTIDNISTAKITEKFTMHFWVYANDYIDGIFEGFSIEWKGHNIIKVEKQITGDYLFKCEIDTKKDLSIEFEMNKWNFLHCAVNYKEREFFMNTYEKNLKADFSYINFPEGLKQDKTLLIIKDFTKEEDWGVLFFQYIRLWSDSFSSPAFLSKIEIIYKNFEGLLHQWNTTFNKFTDMKKVIDNKGDRHFTVTYNSTIIGSNYIDESTYSLLFFCSENGEYYDKKSKECIKFKDLKNSEFSISGIYSSYSHNYGIAFWILFEDFENIGKGVHLRWSNHMAISIEYNTRTLTYCFPQYHYPYKDKIDRSSTVEEIYNEILNKASEININASGKWLFVQCSLSTYNRKFHLNGNMNELIIETLYNDNGQIVKNDEPMGYFNDKDTKLEVKIGKPNGTIVAKQIFLRALYLFRDYIPPNYKYEYMDLTKLTSNSLPALSFAINFASYTINAGKLEVNYIKFDANNDLKTSKVSISIPLIDSMLPANFIYLPLCDPTKKEKYDEETNLCVEISDCNENRLNCKYCSEENTPLICLNSFLSIDSDGKTNCSTNCDFYTRSPGSFNTMGICNTDCLSNDIINTCPHLSSQIQNFKTSFSCNDNYNRINYQCLNKNNINSGALFYSRCNNPFNINHKFKETTLINTKVGYFIEFWMMFDNVYCVDDNNKYFYFIIYPHEIFKENKKYYYSNGNVADKRELKYVHQYEWNKIVIHANIQKGKVNIKDNFNDDEYNSEITSTIPLTLKYLSFCASSTPSCLHTGSPKWGSAFYSNIRIWNYETTSLEIIQAFNSKIFTQTPKCLILQFPLSIQTMDNNIFKNTITSINENIEANQDNKDYNRDHIILHNYSTKFDWGLLNSGKFVYEMENENIKETLFCHPNCKRCYEENNPNRCYECNDGYILQYQSCISTRGNYFLKVPSASNKAINFKIDNPSHDITSIKGLTINFWFKFYGVINGIQIDYPTIISLNSFTYLAYYVDQQLSNPNPNANKIVMRQNNQNAFEYPIEKGKNFNEYLGKWIPISIALYISGTDMNNIYPNIFTLSINHEDIPFSEGYTIPSTGITVTELNIGFEIIALFNDLRIYRTFYQGAFGKIMSKSDTRDINLILHYELKGLDTTTCVINEQLAHDVNINCAPDYSYYFDSIYYCDNDEEYFIYNKVKTCDSCNTECSELCFGKEDYECTCDISKGIYWLRIDNVSLKTYCEKVPYLDFSNINPIKYENAPITNTLEYTIEFWAYFHSYVNEDNFKHLYIEWNFHNQIHIYYGDHLLRIRCYPLFDNSPGSSDVYTDNLSGQLSFDKWNYVKCGTNQLTDKFFLNDKENDIKCLPVYFPNYDNIRNDISKDKYFKIYRSDNFLTNYGFIFLRELKLWQQYNLRLIDDQYINLKTDEIIKFPGLLMFFKNLYKEIGSRLIFREEKSETELPLRYMDDFIGYNIIKEKIAGEEIQVHNLPLCDLGQYYDTINLKCSSPENDLPENCIKISTSPYKCIECREGYFLFIGNGTCVEKCPVKYYGNTNINQCRDCHSTCYECESFLYNTCLKCTGDYYLIEEQKICVEHCEDYDLVKSGIENNKCVAFVVTVDLLYPSDTLPVDIQKFNYIEAKISTTAGSEIKTKWIFNVEETNKINSELGNDYIYENYETPFVSDVENLKAETNNLTEIDIENNLRPFFKLGYKYVFELEIHAVDGDKQVSEKKQWIITINSPPTNGFLKVIPDLGYLNSTTFVITCGGFEDENSVDENNNKINLKYKLYYLEQGTTSNILLKEDNNDENLIEKYLNFTVRYYTEEISYLDIYCSVYDIYNAETTLKKRVKIINKLDSNEYKLKEVLQNYNLEIQLTENQYLARSEYLKSLGINPFRQHQPIQSYTKYENSFDSSSILLNDPYCEDNFCNGNGICDIIDVSICCSCESDYYGNFCHVESNMQETLEKYYKEMFVIVFDIIYTSFQNNKNVDNDLFKSIYNLFFAAQIFFKDYDFFNIYLINFINFLIEEKNFALQNRENIDKLFDFSDFYFNYFYLKENQNKMNNRILSNSDNRNYTLSIEQENIYNNAFKNYIEIMDKLSNFLIKNYNQEYNFISPHFDYYLIKIDETFNETKFYEDNKFQKNYIQYVNFMDCLIDKYSSFEYYLNLITFKQNLFSFNTIFYPNITGSIISIKIYDLNGNEVEINCNKKPLKIFLTFNSYDWVEYLNNHRYLFVQNKYNDPNHPLFTDHVFINKSGEIIYDSIEERIDKYYRKYNFTGLKYSKNDKNGFIQNNIIYDEFRLDFNYILFNTSNTGIFTTMFIPNFGEFTQSGRFFYLPKYQIFKWKKNYSNNPILIIILILLFLYLISCIYFFFYDSEYFQQINELNFLKKEIIKIHNPYYQIEPGINDENLDKFIYQMHRNEDNKNDIKHMFDDYNLAQEKLKLNKDDDQRTNISKHAKFNINDDSNEIGSTRKIIDKERKFHNNNTIDIYKKKNNYFQSEDLKGHKYISIQKFHKQKDEKLNEQINNYKKDSNKNLEDYVSLTLTTSEFIKWNIRKRHIFISPFLNVSIFNKRWIKLFILLTQIYLNMCIISLILTYDKNIIINKNFFKCIISCFLSIIISNLFIYLIAFMFHSSKNDRFKLFNAVISGGQLFILKSWNSIKRKNRCFTFFGIFICLPIWIANFYVSFTFSCVYIEQKKTWILIFIISEILDLMIFEILIELIIGYLFSKRKDNYPSRKVGEFLNRVRSYRTLLP